MVERRESIAIRYVRVCPIPDEELNHLGLAALYRQMQWSNEALPADIDIGSSLY
jgi:hypothetical protein